MCLVTVLNPCLFCLFPQPARVDWGPFTQREMDFGDHSVVLQLNITLPFLTLQDLNSLASELAKEAEQDEAIYQQLNDSEEQI